LEPEDRFREGSLSEAALGRLIVAAAIVFAIGIAVPILAGVAAETILVNEIAFATLVISVATLLKD
jgi:hypothetical protein